MEDDLSGPGKRPASPIENLERDEQPCAKKLNTTSVSMSSLQYESASILPPPPILSSFPLPASHSSNVINLQASLNGNTTSAATATLTTDPTSVSLPSPAVTPVVDPLDQVFDPAITLCPPPFFRTDEILEQISTFEVLKKPARRQLNAGDNKKVAYQEGDQEYNIWYGKYLMDHIEKGFLNREPATYRCSIAKDSGYTKADKMAGNAFFCIYFARGCCTHGADCVFRHRAPQPEDEKLLDASHDIFGRERHHTHREDMNGVGSFSHECRSIFVGGLQIDRTVENPIQKLEETLTEAFSEWGKIEHLRVIHRKGIAFITYHYRVHAEFAKVAMECQSIENFGNVLTVRWAHEYKNTKQETHTNQSNQSTNPGTAQAEAASSARSQKESLLLQTDLGSNQVERTHWQNFFPHLDAASVASTLLTPSHLSASYAPPHGYPYANTAIPSTSTSNDVTATANPKHSTDLSLGPRTKEQEEFDQNQQAISETVLKMQNILNRVEDLEDAAFIVPV